MSLPVPMLRIEVEGVAHSIIQHLRVLNDEMAQIVREEIDAMDIDAMIRAQVRQQVPKIIQDAVGAAVSQIGTEVIREARYEMGPAVRAAIQKAMEVTNDDQHGA